MIFQCISMCFTSCHCLGLDQATGHRLFLKKKPSHSPHSRSRQREAQQWKLAVELGQTALSNAGNIGNAISRSVVSNACRVAGQMSLLREVLGQLEEAGRLSRRVYIDLIG